MLTLEQEVAELGRLLVGKTVARIWRHRPSELVLEFVDGTRLFIDHKTDSLEISVTGADDRSP